jgi:hypothetical protein
MPKEDFTDDQWEELKPFLRIAAKVAKAVRATLEFNYAIGYAETNKTAAAARMTRQYVAVVEEIYRTVKGIQDPYDT